MKKLLFILSLFLLVSGVFVKCIFENSIRCGSYFHHYVLKYAFNYLTGDMDEVTVSKVYDEFSIEFNDDEYTVYGKVKLNFKQEDEGRCRDTFEFSVFYEEDEEPEVEIH